MEFSNQVVTHLCFASGHAFRTWSEGGSKAYGAWETVKGSRRLFSLAKMLRTLDSRWQPTSWEGIRNQRQRVSNLPSGERWNQNVSVTVWGLLVRTIKPHMLTPRTSVRLVAV